MCGRIANPAIGITVDASEDWEAAEATQTHQNTGKLPRRRSDGRTDLLVCNGCYNDYKLAEAHQWSEDDPSKVDEGEKPDDEGEKPDSDDADLAEAIRLSQLEDLDVPREDTELAEAIRRSLSDGGDAASSQSFTASRPPEEKSSESDENLAEAMHLLSKLEVPQEDLDADVG